VAACEGAEKRGDEGQMLDLKIRRERCPNGSPAKRRIETRAQILTRTTTIPAAASSMAPTTP
jgi:hypothetical protein